MPYIGIASRILPILGKFTGFLTRKVADNPKTGDAALLIGTAASVFGVSPETRVILGKALVFIGQALM